MRWSTFFLLKIVLLYKYVLITKQLIQTRWNVKRCISFSLYFKSIAIFIISPFKSTRNVVYSLNRTISIIRQQEENSLKITNSSEIIQKSNEKNVFSAWYQWKIIKTDYGIMNLYVLSLLGLTKLYKLIHIVYLTLLLSLYFFSQSRYRSRYQGPCRWWLKEINYLYMYHLNVWSSQSK